MRIRHATQLDAIDFGKGRGLVPVIAQHALTGEVLMLAYADREALEQTLSGQRMCYFSRSRGKLWTKGETSGNHHTLVALHLDCDRDAILALVLPRGPTCHTGDYSCFSAAPTLPALDDVIAQRAASAQAESYTARLLGDENLRLKKLGEEAIELALACRENDGARVAGEAADLIYHTLVAGAAAGASLESILSVLEERRGSARPARQQAVNGEQHDRAENGDTE